MRLRVSTAQVAVAALKRLGLPGLAGGGGRCLHGPGGRGRIEARQTASPGRLAWRRLHGPGGRGRIEAIYTSRRRTLSLSVSTAQVAVAALKLLMSGEGAAQEAWSPRPRWPW